MGTPWAGGRVPCRVRAIPAARSSCSSATRLDVLPPVWSNSVDPPGRGIMAQQIALNVNGRAVTVAVDDPEMPLLYALRNDLELHGPRFGCGLGQCGACTVLMDGEAVRSCQLPVSAVGDGHITTLEGLGTVEKPHRLQQAFIDEQALQCGYCINRMIIQAAALLTKKPKPSADDIKEARADN